MNEEPLIQQHSQKPDFVTNTTTNPDSLQNILYSNQPSTQQPPKQKTATCNICTEKFNKSARLQLECPFCDFIACRRCCEQYILNSTTIKCMNPECNKEWSRKFIATHFTKKFISTNLKTHREKVLYDQQRALLPATQPLVERNIKLEKIDSEIEELKQAYNKIRRIMNEKYTEKRAVMTGANATRGERATFVRACPDENCRGFLSSQWKCGLCEKWTCNHCHVLKGPDRNIEHTCNPDDIATAELLANDTKPCPSCGTGIFKIDGCDQMWCTSCNTGFSWRTGRIENTIHNPHYFEWLRRNGGQIPRAEGEIQCGREIDNHTAIHIRNRLEKHKTKPNYNDYKIKIAFDED